MGVMVSSSHVVSAAPSSSGGELLTLFPCSSVRSLSQETVLHKLLQCESFPRGAVLQEQAAPEWVPHAATSPPSKPAPAWAPLSTGPQVLAGACSSTGSPQGHSLLQASTCCGMGSLPQATGGSLLHRGPPWAAGGQPASPWSSARVAREDSALVSRAPPPPSFFIDLGVCRIVSFTSSHSSLFTAISLQFVFFLPLLKYVITEALPPSLVGLALASGGSVSEPAGTGFIRHRGSFSQLLVEATPIAPPLPKPCHINP